MYAQEWALACISVYSSIQGKFIINTIDILTQISSRWSQMMKAVIISQECTQPSMQMFPSVTHYFSTGMV